MKKHLIVTDNPSDWHMEMSGVSVVSARDYLTHESFRKQRGLRVYNLCRSYRYQSTGYYVSLLASARGHKPIPSVSTIQDLKSPTIARLLSDELDDLIQKSLTDISADVFTLSVYFGHNTAKRHDRLSSRLFKHFPSPLLRAQFEKEENHWDLVSVKPISLLEIPESHNDDIRDFAVNYFKGKKVPNLKEINFNYDLAILVNPAEVLPPSDEKALQKFVKAGNEFGMSIEFITRDDYSRLAEFDALFIRETTAVNHHTYRFSRKASAEGLVVIDDPDSILKCTNKIYLAELLDAHRIRTPKTIIVHRENLKEVPDKIGFPCILKQPDSAFSQGVKKASDMDQLLELLESLWTKSDLLIAQEYLPTEFDWRIGILDKSVIYACKYFMARNHWQIVKQSNSGKHLDGRVQAVDVREVPENILATGLRAANLIGNGLYGVDIKEIGGKPYVIEINDNPSIDAGYEDQVVKGDLYHSIMRVFRERIEKRKQRHITT